MEEREPTQADLDRWDSEDAREFGFRGYDEELPAERKSRLTPVVKSPHVLFAQCTIVGCRLCAGW